MTGNGGKLAVKALVGRDHTILLLYRNLLRHTGGNHEIPPVGIVGASANTEFVHLLSIGLNRHSL
jgi:hypothetical protein